MIPVAILMPSQSTPVGQSTGLCNIEQTALIRRPTLQASSAITTRIQAPVAEGPVALPPDLTRVNQGSAAMGTIHSFARLQPFDPITRDAMGLAFDTAWQEWLVSGTHLASSAYAATTRKALALHIVDLAQCGERDVNRLRDDAVAFVLDALSLAQEPEAALAMEPEVQSRADSVLSQSGSRIRRTTYWVGDRPVSLVYIPALADEHPETIDYKRPAQARIANHAH
jgi:hypothetical protein